MIDKNGRHMTALHYTRKVAIDPVYTSHNGRYRLGLHYSQERIGQVYKKDRKVALGPAYN